MNGFGTALTVHGPIRVPRQKLAEQSIDGLTSADDDATAASLRLTGAPIEGPTHFSQFDPLAYAACGTAWFERGSTSSQFQDIVVDGEAVQATLAAVSLGDADVDAHKTDGTPALTGTASVTGAGRPSPLATRLAAQQPPTSPWITDQLSVVMTERVTSVITVAELNGPRYPFGPHDKLDAITEPSPWYSSRSNPFGRAIVPFEMISVLAHKDREGFAVRRPSVGLFLDLEVRIDDGSLLVDQPYDVVHTIVAMCESRRTESFWTETSITPAGGGSQAATVMLHSDLFTDLFPGDPQDHPAGEAVRAEGLR